MKGNRSTDDSKREISFKKGSRLNSKEGVCWGGNPNWGNFVGRDRNVGIRFVK